MFSELTKHNKRFEGYFLKKLSRGTTEYTHKRKRPTYDEIKSQLLETKPVSSYYKMHPWARGASESDLMKIEHDINHLKDMRLVNELLHAFAYVPYTGSIERIIDFLDNPELSESVVHPLKWKKDIRIRDKAISIISTVDNWYDYISLMISNYEEGDYNLILSMCKNDYDENEWHAIQWRINEIFEKHKNTYCYELYTLLYMNNRCSLCRKQMVGYMLRDGFNDSEIINELRWDANMDLRELVK